MDVQSSIVNRIDDADALLERLGTALRVGRDRVLHEKVFPRQADVVTVDEWIGALGSA
jgi:hypothetical protein